MTRFTNNPMEEIMKQVLRTPKDRPVQVPPKGHPCQGCKHYGCRCVLPCYRGITSQPV